jgi:hypothetical protein
MKANRRRIPRATSLEELTDEQLVQLRFFGDCSGYAAQPGDGERATAILRSRGYYRWDATRARWLSPRESA